MDNKKNKLFTRRILILGGLKAFILTSLIGRLYYLQVIKSKRYTTLSDSNRIKLFLLPPSRGKIIDNEGRILADNNSNYRILYEPEDKKNAYNIIEKISSLLNIPHDKKQELIKKVKEHNTRNSIMLMQNLTWSQVSKIEVNTLDLPGISIDAGQIRYYPLGNYMANILGYLGPVTEKEIKINPLLNHPDFKIGKDGIEANYESELRGKAGVKRMEVNAYGRIIRELSREESIAGENIRLTVDKRLQQYVGDVLKNKSASSIVMDVTNGNILALNSSPGFDPNEFTYGISKDYWKKLTNDPDVPLINKTVGSPYPPGSIFKTIVALAALKEGIDPNKQIYCSGFTSLGRHRFHCWKEHGHGHLNMYQAIQQSCNVYFYTVAKKIGIESIAKMARQFGLGEKTSLNLNGQKSGIVPSIDWKRQRFNQPWHPGDTLNTAIGQGYVLTTPIQLAVMASRIATGKAVTPNLFMNNKSNNDFTNLDIAKKHLDVVREGMNLVVNSQRGTAYRSRITEPGLEMAGKTGTAQVVSKKHIALFGNKNVDERNQHHGLFIGFAPVNDPKFAIATIIEHGRSGSASAAPASKKILQETERLMLKI